MSQKIVIPKGTIDSAHTTIIEIPNYLHETSTVVVTTPRTADSMHDQPWGQPEYTEESNAEQNETNWEQGYEAPDINDEPEYSPEQPEQYEGYQYDEVENENNVQQQVADQQPSYANYTEEVPRQPARRPRYVEQLSKKQMLDKRRELMKLKAERQRMLEGEIGTYEVAPQQIGRAEQNSPNISEVPENMRERSATREYNLEEKKRRQQEFERFQPYPSHMHAGPVQKEQNSSKYQQQPTNQQYGPGVSSNNQQWNPNPQEYYDVQYFPGQSSVTGPSPHQQRQSANQMGYVQEDPRMYRARRKPTFNAPPN